MPGCTVPKTSVKKREPTPGFASYTSDWHQLQLVQQMMNVDPALMKHLAANRSVSAYDSLEVKAVWHISNPSRWKQYVEARER
jgi:hypothetical protein